MFNLIKVEGLAKRMLGTQSMPKDKKKFGLQVFMETISIQEG